MRSRRYLALLTTLTLSASLITASPAHAGPDDGKVVATRAHVDAPKTYWEGGSFALKTSLPSRSIATKDSVVWIGKGWDSRGRNQYQFTIPNDPALSFLGAPGEVLYSAPDRTLGNHDPVWLGFGADTSLPADTFRDGTASLDLLSVEGPGEVNMFTYYDAPGGLKHLLSSRAEGPRSALLAPGTHTHNFTTFSAPGRYVLTFRTVARDKSGALISSEQSELAIQVGGVQPLDTPTPSLEERISAAPLGSVDKVNYSFRAAPKPDSARDGDAHLSTLSFNAQDETVEGTLTLLLNGHFLADLPVQGGQAQIDELLSTDTSQLQAVFTPSGDNGTRWISPPLDYTSRAAAATVTSQQGSGELPAPRNHPANTTLSVEEYSPTAPGYTASIQPQGDGYSEVTIAFEDKSMRGFLRGGLYEGPDSVSPSQPFEATIEHGKASYIFEDGGWYDDSELRFQVLPHPTITAEAEVLRSQTPHKNGNKQSLQGQLKSVRSAGPVCQDFITIDKGHIDISAIGDDQGLEIKLKDDTGLATPGSVMRRVDEVVVKVGENARETRRAILMDPALDYLGPEGSSLYFLPMTQKHDVVWPGYNTQALNYSLFDGPVNLHLVPRHMPEGAHVGMFLVTDFGRTLTPELDTSIGDHRIETTFATHTHSNWVFTTPGKYVFDTYYSARTKDGRVIESEHQDLRFAVGEGEHDFCDTPSEEPTTPAPTTTPAPSTSPTTPAPTTSPSTPAPTTSAPTTSAPTTSAPSSSPSTSPSTTPGASGSSGPKPGQQSSGFQPWGILAAVLGGSVLAALAKFLMDTLPHLPRLPFQR